MVIRKKKRGLKINATPKNLAAMIIFFILFSTIGLADYTCVNYSYTNFSTIITVSGSSIPINYVEYCQSNCTNVTGYCNVYDPISATFNAVALLIIASLFIVAAIKSSAGIIFHGIDIEFMQPLFFTFAFMLILTAFTIMIVGSRESLAIYNILNSGYFTTMWVFIFFILFMVLSFIINIIQNRLNETIRRGRR